MDGPSDLPATRAAILAGIDRGWHVGAQLEASRRGSVVARLALGEARSGVAMAPDTLVPWFSGTKPITAVAVLQQWERGRLDLDQPVARHLPAFGANGKGAITVRHVLTHTGGFRRLALSPGQIRRVSWEELVAAICAAPLEEGWVPGERAGYHAVSGFCVLGELVRRLDPAGRPLADYVAEEIFEPCDMADSWLTMEPDRHRAYGERMAVPVRTGGSSPEVIGSLAGPDAYVPLLPSGGAVGPMADLVRFYEMLLGGGERRGFRVLRADTVAAMTARQRAGMHDDTFGAVLDWGLGVMVNSWHHGQRPGWYGYGDHAHPDSFGHGGVGTLVSFGDPGSGLAVAVAFNGQLAEGANHERTQPVLNALYEDLGLAPSPSPPTQAR